MKTKTTTKAKTKRHLLQTCEFYGPLNIEGSTIFERCGSPSSVMIEKPIGNNRFEEVYLCPIHDLIEQNEEEN